MLTMLERDNIMDAILETLSENDFTQVCYCVDCKRWAVDGHYDRNGRDAICSFWKCNRHYDDYCSEGLKKAYE